MYLLFDIGGTKMRVTVSKDGQAFGGPNPSTGLRVKIVKTPPKFEEGMGQIKRLVHGLLGNQKITAAAGGIAGPLNQEKSRLVNAPHLPDWLDKPLQDQLEKIVSAPVFIENDTALVGLGEAAVGSGKDHHIVVYMTVSTGVGGVRIVDGRIDDNALGFEPGHQVINASLDENQKSKIKNQKFFTLEDLISGTTVQKRYHKKPAEITDPKIWDELACWLAVGLNNAIVHWSPDVVVLGGSMIAKEVSIPLDRVERHLKNILKIFPAPPPLLKASLGNLGGLHGALVYLKQKQPVL